jgi:nicotinamidase/pyrazinamidase
VKTLILVDIQHDFCPGGALAVPGGNEVVPVANRLAAGCDLVVATQDWHPLDHGSFAANHPGKQPFEVTELAGVPQVLWPIHCVQGTAGAALHSALDVARIHRVFLKGTDPTVDSYSGFFDHGQRRSTGLADYLREQGAREVAVVGLATDYCVRATALDAVALGFRVTLVEDGCRGVELQSGDVARAIDEMRAAAVRVVQSSEFG